MEYEELFGRGEVDGSGDLCTPDEARQWIARVKAVLEPQPGTSTEAQSRLEASGLEYSAWLVAEQNAWLDRCRQQTVTDSVQREV